MTGSKRGQIHRTHSDEFKADAIRRATEPGAVVSDVAEELDLAPSLLARWVRLSKGRILPSDYVKKKDPQTGKGRYYSPDFKAEALRRAAEPGAVIAHIAEEMDVSAFSINAWKRQAEQSPSSPPGNSPPDSRDEEIERLRKQVATLTKERDHLKKTLAHYLSED